MVALSTLVLLAVSVTLTNASPWSLDPLRWAGGTSHWYAGEFLFKLRHAIAVAHALFAQGLTSITSLMRSPKDV